MAKIGRNETCPCGSGKKYKRCCLAANEAAERAAFAERQPVNTDIKLDDDYCDEEEELALELTLASNAVIDMIEAGELDEAERAAQDLLARYPDVHDGYDRLGSVCEARGDKVRAVEYYRQALACVRQNPDGYEPQVEKLYLELIEHIETQIQPGSGGE